MSHQEPRHNLPVRLTSFVGREHELAEVFRVLADARLVTLVGAPGIGKTRLAVEAAGGLVDRFSAGVALVELAAVAEPALLVQIVATAVGVTEQVGRPLPDTLLDSLRSRHLLLVLDNCEHLRDACAAFAESVLRGCPDVRILATSREPLGVEGETLWHVPSLSQPVGGRLIPHGELLQYESVRLFAERAAAVRSGFAVTDQNAQAVAQICRRLDGIPLALELAAARVNVLSVAQIADRLDDALRLLVSRWRTAPPRYRTLRATIEWSHALLSEPERVLLRRLSVFGGGWTLEGAERVCGGDDIDCPEVLDLLGGLVDRSLVLVSERDGVARYGLLETIRQYGLEKLAAAGEEAATRRRHLAYFVERAEQAEPRLFGADAAAWIERLAGEQDNVRAALAWSLADPAPAAIEAGVRLASAFFLVWFNRDQMTEGRRWLEQVIAADRERAGRGGGDGAPPGGGAGVGGDKQVAPRRCGYGGHPRVAARVALGGLAYHQQDHAHVTAALEDAVDLARELGDRPGIGHALVTLSYLARARGDLDRSRAQGEEALRLFEEVGDDYGAWRALQSLGETTTMLGDYGRARRYLQQSLDMSRSAGDPRGVAQALRVLGQVAYRQGDLEQAAAYLEESLDWWAKLRVTRGPHWSLAELGYVALAQGDPQRAATCFARSLMLCRDAGDPRGIAQCLGGLAATATARTPDERRPAALCAGRLLGAAAALRDAIGVPVSPLDRPTFELAMRTARAAVGQKDFDAALSEGRSLSTDQAIELALATADPAGSPSPSVSADRRADRPPTDGPWSILSRRERDVAALVGRGLTNRQIAAELVVSERTVDGHVARILAKLGFVTRAQIAAWTARHERDASRSP
ncbi:MAG: tetratricopeptide repeat protein [Chloroflexota bacterium]|nr:tetratricopeptide repeat protein [Chloroflexota bacterium]